MERPLWCLKIREIEVQDVVAAGGELARKLDWKGMADKVMDYDPNVAHF